MTQLFNPADLIHLLPEIVVTVTALLVLLVDLAARGRERTWLASLSVLGAVVALVIVTRQMTGS